MLPKEFYPMAWNLFHTSTAYWSKNPSKGEQIEMKYFLIGLPALIPCELCKSHIRQWNLAHNLNDIVTSKRKVFEYLVSLHNKVNKSHKKQEWTFQQAAKHYGYLDY
jgi:3-methyladenine DNA glycosylase AlkC